MHIRNVRILLRRNKLFVVRIKRAYLDSEAMVIRLIILEILYLASNPIL